jgi:ribosome maturation factor RimP
MASNDRLQRIREVIEPVLEHTSVELVDVRILVQKGRRVLRLYIDKPGGVDLHDCTTVSREVSVRLDVHNIIPGRYTLEVSSPGLDRPLQKPSDFQRNEGRTLKVLARGSNGVKRQLVGELISCGGEGILLDVKGEETPVAFGDIESAKVEPKF